jgi:hypothetical protein
VVALAEGHFDVLVTIDKNIRYQQNMTGRNISVLMPLLTYRSWQTEFDWGWHETTPDGRQALSNPVTSCLLVTRTKLVKALMFHYGSMIDSTTGAIILA